MNHRTPLFNRRWLHILAASLFLLSWSAFASAQQALAQESTTSTAYREASVDGVRIFYREAGRKSAPHVLLLHGFGASSAMFRELIPLLAAQYHVVAPDLPGFGMTEVPSSRNYPYSFDSITKTVAAFTDHVGLDRYSVYLFDYGAPTGFRLALANPERIQAIITQNGNAYEEGLSKAWAPIQAYWKEPSVANRNALRGLLTLETTKWQYTEGVPNKEIVSPDGITAAQLAMDRPGNADIQLDLFRDYASNVALYPQFQAYFRRHQPPLLAVWGKNDPFFVPAGATAFKRDLPKAEVHLLDSGHFALETHPHEIARHILRFLAQVHAPSR